MEDMQNKNETQADLLLNENTYDETVRVSAPASAPVSAPAAAAPEQPVEIEIDIMEPAPAQPGPATPVYTAPVRNAQPVNVQPGLNAMPNQQPVRNYTAVQPKPKKKKSGFWWKALIAIFLAGLIAVGSSFLTAVIILIQDDASWQEQFQLHQETVDNKIKVISKENNTSGQTNPDAPAQEGMTPAQVYNQNVGAVVAIANEGVTTNIFGQVSKTASSGSGFIISADGYVVSNYHVVKDAQTLTVILADGTEYDAKVVGFDEANDVSLMKIEATDLPYVTLGVSDDLVVGDQVCAIGNPLGELTSTLTVGYVSVKERSISTDGGSLDMIQTDAAINSGNSGGPLFNTKGEVVGIITAKYSGTSTAGATIEGIGFAIPIDDVKGILSDLQEYGYVTSGYLGVEVRDVDSSGVSYGLPEGAFVVTVEKGFAAEKAGIQEKDIIVDLGGYEISGVDDLLKALRSIEVGQETTVTVYRSGQRINLKITPEAKPQEQG